MLAFRGWSLGFRVWGLRFGVISLGDVWNLGLGAA